MTESLYVHFKHEVFWLKKEKILELIKFSQSLDFGIWIPRIPRILIRCNVTSEVLSVSILINFGIFSKRF